MAILTSEALITSVIPAQREAVQKLEHPPVLALVRQYDPDHPKTPEASYARRIVDHGRRIGAGVMYLNSQPGSKWTTTDLVERALKSGYYAGVMPLYPQHDKMATRALLETNPQADVDDLLGHGEGAPTALAMLTMARLGLEQIHGSGDPTQAFAGKRLAELPTLELGRYGFSAGNLRIGGKGELTTGPLANILERQGVFLDPSQVATKENPEALRDLPAPGLILTAVPMKEQIRNNDINNGSVVVDASCVVEGNEMFGNTERTVAARPNVTWTPPESGVGPVSTAFLWDNVLRAAGLEAEDLPVLQPRMPVPA